MTGEHWPIISNVAQGLPGNAEFYRPGIFGIVSLLHFACLLHGLLFLTSTFLKKIQIKHCLLEHGGMQAEFSMRVSGRFSSCLVRQVNEAVRIGMSEDDCLMNSKAEFHQAPLVRVVATTGLQDGQEERLEAARGGRGRGGRRHGGGG